MVCKLPYSLIMSFMVCITDCIVGQIKMINNVGFMELNEIQTLILAQDTLILADWGLISGVLLVLFAWLFNHKTTLTKLQAFGALGFFILFFIFFYGEIFKRFNNINALELERKVLVDNKCSAQIKELNRELRIKKEKKEEIRHCDWDSEIDDLSVTNCALIASKCLLESWMPKTDLKSNFIDNNWVELHKAGYLLLVFLVFSLIILKASGRLNSKNGQIHQ
jgi:hypothetical protein